MILYKLILIITILSCFFILYKSLFRIEHFNVNNDFDKYIWCYWEGDQPEYIKLCLFIMKKRLNKYKFNILDDKTINNYLPEIDKENKEKLNKLQVAQKVDYYRLLLLQKYGGIWLDCDIILLSDLEEIFTKLQYYDYVGFGCTGYKCSNGYLKPSNWCMASRKNGLLINKCVEIINNKLKSYDFNITQSDDTYHDFGKLIIWDALNQIGPAYTYYHFTSHYDGTRDIKEEWINCDKLFSDKKNTKFLDENKLLFVVLYNSEINKNSKYKEISQSLDKLLNGNDLVCYLFNKALLNYKYPLS